MVRYPYFYPAEDKKFVETQNNGNKSGTLPKGKDDKNGIEEFCSHRLNLSLWMWKNTPDKEVRLKN